MEAEELFDVRIECFIFHPLEVQALKLIIGEPRASLHHMFSADSLNGTVMKSPF